MTLKIVLSDVKEGDTIFNSIDGYCKLVKTCDDYDFPFIKGANGVFYTYHGKNDLNDKHPSCFHSIEECIEYFQSVKKDMDKRFSLFRRNWP